MSATVTALEFAGLGVCAMVVAYVSESLAPGVQDLTALGLLSVVIVGIGRYLVQEVKTSGDKTAAAIEKSGDKTAAAMDRCTAAMSQTATSLALLAQESESSRMQQSAATQQILAKLEQIHTYTAKP